MSNVITVENVTKIHRSGSDEVRALDDVSTGILQGEFVAVMGPSGSGKSTFLNLIGGLDTPTTGKIYVDGQEITSISLTERAKMRRQKIGYVFQDFNLISTLTLAENVALPMELDGHKSSEVRPLAIATLKELGIDELADRFPSQVSRGQAQRAAIARGLIGEGRVLLADEPTGALDSNLAEDIMRVLRSRVDVGATVVLVTHEPRFAGWADRVIYIRDGKIEDGENR